MYEIIFLFAEAFILGMLIISLRKGALCPFPDVAIIYLGFLEMVLFLQVSGIIDYKFLETYSSYSFENNFGIISLCLCIYSTILYFSKIKGVKKVDYGALFRKINIPPYATAIAAIFIYLYTFTMIINADIALMWKTDTYLLVTSPDVMQSHSDFARGLPLLISPISLISATLFFFLYLKGDRTHWLFAPVFLWWFFYLIGAHSRAAALMLGIGIFLALFLGRRILATGLALLVMISIAQALAGRAGDLHGLSQVSNMFTLAMEGFGDGFDQIIANTGEGIFVSSEALTFHPTLSATYFFLSFSPLVNAIDGFQEILARDGVRLSEYVPMSAINELTAFGWPYLIIYLAFQFFAGRTTTKLLNKKPGLLAIFLNVVIMFGFLQQFAYSLRTCFRWFFYPMIICMFL